MQEREFKDVELSGRTYTIYKFTATKGREIVAKYSISSLPKVGDYETNELAMLEMMRFVSVKLKDDTKVFLNDKVLIDKYVPNFKDLLKLELMILEYNCDFLLSGAVSNFLVDMSQKAEGKIMSILTQSLQSVFQAEKPH